MEHVSPRYHDDVEACWQLGSPEEFARPSFDAVPFDRRPQLPGCRNAEPWCLASVGQYEERHEASLDPVPVLVDTLELGSLTDAFGAAQGL